MCPEERDVFYSDYPQHEEEVKKHVQKSQENSMTIKAKVTSKYIKLYMKDPSTDVEITVKLFITSQDEVDWNTKRQSNYVGGWKYD